MDGLAFIAISSHLVIRLLQRQGTLHALRNTTVHEVARDKACDAGGNMADKNPLSMHGKGQKCLRMEHECVRKKQKIQKERVL